jgi:hypothetical protein
LRTAPTTQDPLTSKELQGWIAGTLRSKANAVNCRQKSLLELLDEA